MKLIDALNILKQKPQAGVDPYRFALVCGFTPLHLQTFLHAELQQRFPNRHIQISTGVFGDITGTLETLKLDSLETVAIVLEWFDLDPRFGLRQLGGWGTSISESALGRARTWLSHLDLLVDRISQTVPVVISLPTLPLPPLFLTANRQASSFELELREVLATWAASISRKRIRLLNSQLLDHISPLAGRLNVKSDWTSGFPYQLPHASSIAAIIAELIHNPPPKKALITDLDNTLWNGIVGEVGPQGTNWDLDHGSQAFGLYQQMLQTLSNEGILLAVVSKNDPAVVEEAFARDDLLLSRSSLSFLEVSWGSKAKAVGRILGGWNIGPEAVLVIDDNPIELAEIKAAYPDVECLEFPYKEPGQIHALVLKLRDYFGKERISEEDRLRTESIRTQTQFRINSHEDSAGFSESLLEQAHAELTLSFSKDSSDHRAFELVNKTNQFNLNGERFTEAAWRSYIAQEDVFLLTGRYKDRFGSLGKIAVLTGRFAGETLTVDVWVMSCRAFARRIEHQCVRRLFERFHSDEMFFNFRKQARNGPISGFFEGFQTSNVGALVRLTRKAFEASCPKLFHDVVELDS
jgi:FkbH-like protein